MKIITRYLFKDIFHNFFLFLSIFVVVLMVNEIYDTRDDLLKNSPGVLNVILFLICGVPGQLAQTLPMIGLMATIFAYGLLAKNKEILAMVAAGISFEKIGLPAFIFGIGLTVFMFWWNESVVPASQAKARTIEKVYLQGQNESVLTRRRNLFVKGAGNRFFYMQNYLADRQEMVFPTIMVMSDSGAGLAERVEAERGKLQSDGRTWEFTGAERWTFNPDGALKSYDKFTVPLQLVMEERLDKFLSKAKKPDDMNFQELREHVAMLRQQGDTHLQSYSTTLQQKLGFPWACLLMALLGFCVVADVHARHFARGVSTGLLIAIAFYIFFYFLKGMGDKGIVTPVIAGWLPSIVFAVVVYVLLIRMRQIRA